MKTGTIAIITALVIATALASGPTVFAGDAVPLIAPVCPADLNADSIVDGADLDRLLRSYGACMSCEEDLNQDNFVDDADVTIMIKQWGPCPPEGDVFGGDHSSGSLVGDSGSLTDFADSGSLTDFADSGSLTDFGDSGSLTDTADADSLVESSKYRTTTTLVAPRCKGDLNGDTFVDAQDTAHLLLYYGSCLACEEDLNDDGLVDDADAQIIDQQWGPCSPEGDVFGGDHSKGSLTDSADSLSDMENKASDDKKGTPEDVNGDGIVDMVDIVTVAEHMGQVPTGDKAFSDVNNDGRIDKFDIQTIAEYVISGESIGA